MSLSPRAARRGAEALGLGWALGMALFTALSFVLYVAGVPGGAAVAAAFAAALTGTTVAVRAVYASRRDDEGPTDGGAPAGPSLVAIVALGLAGARVALAASWAMRAPFSAYDAWSFWALKARMFASGGPRPGYFRDPLTLHTHPDYPLNLPLAAAPFFRLPGSLGVTLAAMIGPACLAALLLLLYAGLARLHGATPAALATAALSFVPALTAQAANDDADVLVALYVGGSALYLLLWWRLRRPVDALLMGLLAGGALWTKKEGLPVAALLLAAYLAGEALRAGYWERWRLAGRPSQGAHWERRRPAGRPSRTAHWERRRDAGRPSRAGESPEGPVSPAGGRRDAGAPGRATVRTALDGLPAAYRAWQPLGVLAAAAVFPLPWLIFSRVVRPLGRDFLPLTPSVFLAHIDRLPHILTLFALQTLDFANWSLLWVLTAVVLLLAARRLPPHGRGILLLVLGQIGVYALSFVFSDWQPYTAHVQTSLDRLLVQATPLALLLLVESVGALAGGRAVADGRADGPAHGVTASAAR